MKAQSLIQIGQRKVAIIGVGYVGATISYALTLRDLAREIVLIDPAREKALGEAMDIQHGVSSMGTSAVRLGDYEDCQDADLIIITAGRNRKPGETRLNLIDDNKEIMAGIVRNLKPSYTHGAILVVCNPVDIMTYLCDKWMGLPNGTVFGTGCLLDTSRLIRLTADYVGLSTHVVHGMVVGEHGDSQIPVWSRLSVGGIGIGEYCDAKGLAWNDGVRTNMADKVKKMGAAIIRAKGRTHYGIATCVCMLADAILNQRPTIAPVTSTLQGEYGIEGVALSVPSVVGVSGVDHRLTETWSNEEQARFQESAGKLKEVVKGL